MALTKARTSLIAGTLTASSADTSSAAIDVTDSYGSVVEVKLTNGATGPTVPAQAQITVSNDDTTYFNWGGALIGSTANNGVVSWVVEIPIGVMYVKLVAGSNTGQNVTIASDISQVTAL